MAEALRAEERPLQLVGQLLRHFKLLEPPWKPSSTMLGVMGYGFVQCYILRLEGVIDGLMLPTHQLIPRPVSPLKTGNGACFMPLADARTNVITVFSGFELDLKLALTPRIYSSGSPIDL